MASEFVLQPFVENLAKESRLTDWDEMPLQKSIDICPELWRYEIERQYRSKEANMVEAHQNEIWKASIDASGRVLLPVELRRTLSVQPGNELIWSRDDKGVHLRTLDEVLNETQAYFGSIESPASKWSDELIAQRRAEFDLE